MQKKNNYINSVVKIFTISKQQKGGACGTYGRRERRVQDFGGETWGKEPLGRPRRRREDNIKMDLQEVGRGCGDRMGLAKDRDRWRALVSTVMNFRVP